MQYYYSDGDQQKGPVDEEGLKAAGLGPDTLVWREGMNQWQPAREVTELASLLSTPTASQDDAYSSQPAIQQASFSSSAQPAVDTQQRPPTATYPAPASLGYSQPTHQTGYPPQQIQYGGYVGPVSPPAPGMAIASLVLGIIAIPTTFCYGFGTLLAILAIIFGHLAQSQARRETGQGNGMALAGLVCGYIAISVVVCLFLFFFAIFGAAAWR